MALLDWAAGNLQRPWSRTSREATNIERCIRDLALPPRPLLMQVIEHVSDKQGRQISLVPSHLRHLGLSGAWLDIGDRDLIVYETTASSRIQRYIICHEIGHMVLNHRQLDASQILQRIEMGDGSSVCGSAYNDKFEDDADAVARLLLSRLSKLSEIKDYSGELNTVVGRIAATLKHSA
ncbi:MAG: ImmA/IrrE family metallo-endopeptidase [Mycobacteriaceae bacterium]|nr:ImmA/IrrE family metallo-endopeptidase [Mycobacteriaceae bacterium]